MSRARTGGHRPSRQPLRRGSAITWAVRDAGLVLISGEDRYYRAGEWAPFDVATLFTDPQERARMASITSVLTNDRIIADSGAYADFLLPLCPLPRVGRPAIGLVNYPYEGVRSACYDGRGC